MFIYVLYPWNLTQRKSRSSRLDLSPTVYTMMSACCVCPSVCLCKWEIRIIKLCHRWVMAGKTGCPPLLPFPWNPPTDTLNSWRHQPQPQEPPLHSKSKRWLKDRGVPCHLCLHLGIYEPDSPSTHQEMLIHKHVQTYGLHRGIPTQNIHTSGLKVVLLIKQQTTRRVSSDFSECHFLRGRTGWRRKRCIFRWGE